MFCGDNENLEMCDRWGTLYSVPYTPQSKMRSTYNEDVSYFSFTPQKMNSIELIQNCRL
jgi:hypothetical protein